MLVSFPPPWFQSREDQRGVMWRWPSDWVRSAEEKNSRFSHELGHVMFILGPCCEPCWKYVVPLCSVFKQIQLEAVLLLASLAEDRFITVIHKSLNVLCWETASKFFLLLINLRFTFYYITIQNDSLISLKINDLWCLPMHSTMWFIIVDFSSLVVLLNW